MMSSFGRGASEAELSQLRSTMEAIEVACFSIQSYMDVPAAEATIQAFRRSPQPYQLCRFILEKSQLANARFQAAAAIQDAALREWGFLAAEDKRSLITFCLCYSMEHASSADAYVQAKVSSVGALLMKRGWMELSAAEKDAFFSEVNRAIHGAHGVDAQFAGISFLESLVCEFSPSTSSAIGLPVEFYEQCGASLELDYLQKFYCWAQEAALNVTDKAIGLVATVTELKVFSAALRLMFQIMNWEFRSTANGAYNSSNCRTMLSSGFRRHAVLLTKYECVLVEPGPTWRDVLISSGHIDWLLRVYGVLRQKLASDKIWSDSPLAVSARQLIVQFCSLTGSIFPLDDGQMQKKNLLQLLSAIIQWIDPPDVVIAAIKDGASESELLDGCHALLSIATLTSTELFDDLLKSFRNYGTLQLLSSLTCEVVKAHALANDEEVEWCSEPLDVLLETWSILFGQTDLDKKVLASDGIDAAAKLFYTIVDSQLKAAAASAFDAEDDAEHFHASVSKRDERFSLYAIIARVAADITVPLLMRLLSERFALLHEGKGITDPTCTLEEIYWILLMAGHVLTDPGEGETPLVPEALEVRFLDVNEAVQHPLILISGSVLNFAEQSLDSELRTAFFSPRLLEAVIWFLARWAGTYLMPFKSSERHNYNPGHEDTPQNNNQISRKALLGFYGEDERGKHVLDIIVRISMTALISYPGEVDLQEITCYQLLPTLVRRRNLCAHLIELSSWRNLANAFANERTFFTLSARLQRSIAETLVRSASGMQLSEASNLYVRDLMGPMTTYLMDISNKSDLKIVAQQPDAIHMVSCLLERLRGTARATQPRTQKAIFEMAVAVMIPLLNFLEIYKNETVIIHMILKFVVDLVDAQVAFLENKETAILVNFCMKLLQIYSAQNIGKVSVSSSSSLLSQVKVEKYKDLRALLKLLTNLCSKDLVDFSHTFGEENSTDIAQVVYLGLHIVTPLISLDLLKYPKLCRDYFALMSHMLDVYPEKVVELNAEAFAHIIRTLDFGIPHQDIDVVSMCLRAVNALATYHYKEKSIGKEGLGTYAISCQGLNGEGTLRHFLQLLLQHFLFEDYSSDLISHAADALLPLILCELDLYQRLASELVERQVNPAFKSRLANALQVLTTSNEITSTLDRANYKKFRKNFHNFLIEVRGFLWTK